MLPLYDVKSVNPGEVEVSGNFTVAGGALGTVVGSGFTVTDAGVGTFTVTMAERWSRFISVTASIATAAGADVLIQTTVPTVTAGVAAFTILEWDVSGGALADVNGTISFSAKLSTLV